MKRVSNNNQLHNKIKDCVLISLFTAIIAVSSFITIPSPVPFTLQTLAVFCTLTILEGKKGFLAITLYVILGAIGLPVFSNFSGGVGHLSGATGGYISGFILTALVYSLVTRLSSNNNRTKAVGLFTGLLACYAFGTFWYVAIYLKDLNLQTFLSSLSICVLPFVIPDLIKIRIALLIDKKLSPFIN